MADVKFVNMEDKDHVARILVEMEFVSTIREDQNARIVAEVKFVSTAKKDQHAPHAVPMDTLPEVVRSPVCIALKNNKEMGSSEYLGCNIETFKKHIEQQFIESMSWKNYGE